MNKGKPNKDEMQKFSKLFLLQFEKDTIQHDGGSSNIVDEILVRGDAGQYSVIYDNDDEENCNFSETSTNTFKTTDAQNRQLVINTLNDTINSFDNMTNEAFDELTKTYSDPKYSVKMGEKGTGSSSTG